MKKCFKEEQNRVLMFKYYNYIKKRLFLCKYFYMAEFNQQNQRARQIFRILINQKFRPWKIEYYFYLNNSTSS